MSADGSAIDAVFWVCAFAGVALAGVRGVRAVRAARDRRALVAARVLASGLLVVLAASTAAGVLCALVGSGHSVSFGSVEVARGFVVVTGQPKGLGLLMTDLPEQVHQLYGQAIGLDLNSTLRVRLEPSFGDQLVAWLLFAVAVAAVAVPIALVRGILARAAAGEAFTARTVRLVDALGVVVAAGWLIVVPLQRVLTGHLLAHAGASAGFAWPAVGPQVLAGLAILALARIWREALPARERAPATASAPAGAPRAAAAPPPARP